jgi:hypothetical protein
MQTTLRKIPEHLITLVQSLRARLRDPGFVARHRVQSVDFTRQRALPFSRLVLFVLQQSVKSLQRHLDEFFERLTQGESPDLVTPGAVTHARAKLQETAFIELNHDCVLPSLYETERLIRRWRGHRLIGVDSSLLRLPNSEELGQAFGWKEAANQSGATGTRFPEARLSVLYDLLNRVGWEARLASSLVGEVALAQQQLPQLQAGDVAINDRGYTGYVYLALVWQQSAHFIARCSTGSFLTAQELFQRDQPNRSLIVWLHAPRDQKAECQRLGLPLQMKVRFVSLRLPSGGLEVLVTSLLDEALYPTKEFLTVYHWRWGHETFHLMLKGRLELENFTGRTLEAVHQEVQGALLLANLESLLSEPTQALLDAPSRPRRYDYQVNRANSYHAIKDQVLDLLYGAKPVAVVIGKLLRLFGGSPVAVRPARTAPRRTKPSFHRSYHFQRRVKKIVF